MFTGFAVLAVALAAGPAAPSTAELEGVGRDLAAQLSQGVDALGPLVNANAMADRAFAGVTLPKGFRDGFDRSFKSMGTKLGAMVTQSVKGGARLSFRKVVMLDGLPALQLRLLLPSGAFTILELALQRGAEGRFEVVDLYDLSAGELKSVEIRRLALAALAESDQSILDKLMGKEQLLIKHAADIQAMTASVTSGRYEDALRQYEALPKAVQEQRSVLRNGITAAAEVDTKKYEQAIGRYLTLYPNDAASNVMAIDFYFFRKRWADVEKAIGIVEARVGKDEPWFEVLRGSVAMEQHHDDDAKKHFVAAIARDKTFTDPYFVLMDLAKKEQRWADLAKWLEAIEADAHVELKDPATVEGNEAFVASKEGKAFLKRWRAAHGAKVK